METIFLKLLNMSIAASWLVLVVVMLRMVLRKAPKEIRCFLWGMVAVRLICPFSIESVLSLIPSPETVPEDIMYMQKPTVHTGIEVINNMVNPVLSENFTPIVEKSVNPMQVLSQIASVVWVIGFAAMVIYATFSYFRIHRKVAASINLEHNLYLCDYIDTPFILGMVKPKIYLPSVLETEQVSYVIAHENAHLKRHDHWWKPIGFVLLSVYWFNPFIWLAYILFCRDIEFACDERVIRQLGTVEKKSYAEILLLCSIPRKMVVGCPLAFGEVGVKERVRTVLNYKKPKFWIMMTAVVACIAVAICFLTDPKSEASPTPETTVLENMQDNIQVNLSETELPESGGLTMEKLLELCEGGSEALRAAMTEIGGNGDAPYSNFVKEGEETDGALTWHYVCDLPYNGREYTLQVDYWKAEMAEMYNHSADELYNIFINYPAVGDTQLLYTTEQTLTSDTDLPAFLEKEYDLNSYLTLELPDNLSLGNYRVGMSVFGDGCLFEGDYEEIPHGESAMESCYAPGGVGHMKLDKESNPDFVYFENGKLQGIDWDYSNLVWRESDFEYVDGCNMQAVICEYDFQVYTAPEMEEYMEKNSVEADEFQTVSKYWYVIFAEPESEYVYSLFMNQEYFSKEDTIAVAKTIEFKQ